MTAITHSLFEEEWWLELAAPKSWGAVVVRNGDQVHARLPYRLSRAGPWKKLDMPLFSMNLGPWISPSEAKPAKALSREKELMTELIRKLPTHSVFEQNFHHSVSNWMPFYWEGFSQSTAYTYVIPDLSDPQRVWNGFLDNARTDIRKGEKRLAIRTDLSALEFVRMNRMTFARQGTEPYYADDELERLVEGARALGRGGCWFAVDSEGRTHAAIFVVWDERSAFFLAGGGDPELRNSGATSFVLWSAMRDLAGKTKAFNFDGSMLAPVEKFFRSFGGMQTPYSRVSRYSRSARAAKLLRELVRG